jgi:aryl carrier-like protein
LDYVAVDRNSLTMEQHVRYVDADDTNAVRLAIEGPPVEHCRVRIAGAKGRDLGQEVIGELQLQGANVTAGYYNDPDATRGLFTTDGWLHTGDLGFLRDGQVVVTGRLKDIIFVNGQNFYPHDLEAVALSDDRLEIGKVVVLGVRRNDADHDEVLVCVLFRGELTEFVPIVKSVRLIVTKHTGVEVTHVLPVRRIPKTTSGKVQRRFFADAYLAGEFDRTIADLGKLLAPAHEASSGETSHDLLVFLKSIFDRIVAERHVGMQDDFFEIGMSSLELAQIHEQVEEAYPGILDITDLFDHPTIESLADLLSKKLNQPLASKQAG